MLEDTNSLDGAHLLVRSTVIKIFQPSEKKKMTLISYFNFELLYIMSDSCRSINNSRCSYLNDDQCLEQIVLSTGQR